MWRCEGPSHSHSDITTNCWHSVVVHSWGVQSFPQYHTDSVSCCASLSGLSRVRQVHVGWVRPILDCTVSRASEPRQKCELKLIINRRAHIHHCYTYDIVICTCINRYNIVNEWEETLKKSTLESGPCMRLLFTRENTKYFLESLP